MPRPLLLDDSVPANALEGFAQNGVWIMNGILTPTALAGNVNDYAPAGLATANIVRIGLGAVARNMTGLKAQQAGRVVIIQNIDASASLTLKNLSGSSAAANQIQGAGLADVVIRAGGSCMLWYDGTSSLWVPVAI